MPVTINQKVTNTHGLHDVIYHALSLTDYGGYVAPPNKLSVTELIDAPQAVWLRRKHQDHLKIDALDLVPAMMGKSVHTLFEGLEDVMPERYLMEKRVKVKIGDWIISGRFDAVDLLRRQGITLYDLKNTSVWSVILGDKMEWIMQTNVYVFFLRNIGYYEEETNSYVKLNITDAWIIAMLKDWNETKSKFERDYPRRAVHEVQMKLYSDAAVWKWIQERLAKHAIARDAVYNNTTSPQCTEKERWAKDTKWAVFAEGGTRASKICNSEQEANEYIAEKMASGDTGFFNPRIDIRYGENTRCEKYCSVKDFCPQYNTYYRQDPI